MSSRETELGNACNRLRSESARNSPAAIHRASRTNTRKANRSSWSAWQVHEIAGHCFLSVGFSRLLPDPLLGRVRERIERGAQRVRAAFALEETASWFERPERVDSKTVVDTRRFRLGMVLERVLPGDAALIARVEALVQEQPTHVRDAFGLEGAGPSWFDRCLHATPPLRLTLT